MTTRTTLNKDHGNNNNNKILFHIQKCIHIKEKDRFTNQRTMNYVHEPVHSQFWKL